MKSIVGTEQETDIQTSTALAQTDMGMYGHQSGDFDVSIVWNVLRRRWLLMTIVMVVVLATGAYFVIKEKPLYEAAALVVVSTDRMRTASAGSDEMSTVNDLLNLAKARSMAGQIQVLQSPDLQFEVVSKLGQEAMISGFGEEALTSGSIIPDWALSIESPKDSDVIQITAKAYSPQVAADLANTTVRTYLGRDQGFSTQAAKQGREYVSRELENVKAQLNKSQKLLSEYKSKSRLVVPESQVSTVASNATSMEMEYDKANIDATAARQQLEAVKRQLAAEGKTIDTGYNVAVNPLYQDAQSKLNQLNVERASLLQDYTANSPEVERVSSEISAVQAQLKDIAQKVIPSKSISRNPMLAEYMSAVVNYSSAQARARALGGVVSKRNSQLTALPEKERQYAVLMQQVSVLDRTYQMLSDKYYSLLINEKSTMPSALFAANARVPIIPVNSRRKMVPLIILLGLMLAAGAAALAEKLDKTVRDEARMVALTGDGPLAVIPKVKDIGSPLSQMSGDGNIGLVESFRMLRNSIYFADVAKPIKVMAVTSPGHGEGKSTTSICLGITMAMDGKRVLVIDADFRRPSLYRWIDVNSDLGLSYVLAGEATVEEAIIPTGLPNLFCLPAGPMPKNPSEFLNSRASHEMLAMLSKSYDMIILDCPPCAGLSDMQVVSRLVDGVLLVISVDATLKKRLDEGVNLLARVHAPLLGYVINQFRINTNGYDYYTSTQDLGLEKWKKD